MKIEIDLNAKFIGKETRLWRIFPGKSYEFLKEFLENGLVYLNFPDLFLPEENKSDKSRKELKQALIHSHNILEWESVLRDYNKNKTEGKPPEKPGRPLKEAEHSIPYSGYTADLGIVERFFYEMRKGDLVLIPSPGWDRTFYVAEILEDPAQRIQIDLSDASNTKTFARKVKIFPSVNELRIPYALSKLLRTQSAFIQIQNEYLGLICELSYGTFFRDNYFVSRLQTQAQEFDNQDTIDLSILVSLAAKLASDFRNERKLTVELSALISSPLPDEDVMSIAININSPGFVTSRASSLAPLLLGALFALFTSVPANAKPNPHQIQVVNSSSSDDDECTVQINKLVQDTIQMMGFQEWQDQCERALRLAKSPKMVSDVRVSK